MSEERGWIDRKTYDLELSEVYRSVFSGQHIHELPFRSSEWSCSLLNGDLHGIEEPDFEALVTAIRSTGDTRFFARCPTEEYPSTVERSFAYDAPRLPTSLEMCRPELHIFGKSGAWGLVTDMEGIGILGGKPSFIQVYETAIGGRSHLMSEMRANHFLIPETLLAKLYFRAFGEEMS
ncbi:MAG: hypothetical protein O3A57_12290 [Bacteroidetes bacterium]|nr:hypothetical protein [Bacteroidota bacterium]